MSDARLYEVIAEAAFEAPVEPARLTALGHVCSWCFEAHRVHLVGVLLSYDRKRALALFHAPDAESVRLACHLADIHFERIWTCERLPSDA